MKCKDKASYFHKNKKYRPFEIEKKNFFSVISFQKFLIFHKCVFQKMLHVSPEHSFKQKVKIIDFQVIYNSIDYGNLEQNDI